MAWTYEEHYRARCDHFRNVLALLPEEPAVRAVLLGDSLSEGHPPHAAVGGYRVINLGISGERANAIGPEYGIPPRLGLVTAAAPRLVFLLLGTNDLLNAHPPSDVESAIHDLLPQIQGAAPGATIVLTTIPPARDVYAHLNPLIAECNARIGTLAQSTGYPLFDLAPHLTTEDGLLREEFTYDGVHLTPQGYDVWTARLAEFLADFP